MEGKARFLGHSLHPMLIVFPLGVLVTAVAFDVLYIIWGDPVFESAAYWMTAGGLLGAIAAAPLACRNWSAALADARTKSLGLAEGLVNILVVVLFIANWYYRNDNPAHPPLGAHALGITGAFFALIGGWLSGELVSIGFRAGANYNAPSPLRTNIAARRRPYAH